MDKVNGKLTVFFEEPFWVGIFERIEDGKLSVAKVTFGAEPKDYEVQEYIQKCYFSLKFSPVVETVVKVHIKLFSKKSIPLDRDHCIFFSVYIFGIDINLRSVESSFSNILCEWNVQQTL